MTDKLKRLGSIFRVFDSTLLNLLFWEFVAVLLFQIMFNAEFIYGDEHAYLASILKGALQKSPSNYSIGRCYPFAHTDCNFVFLLPHCFREHLAVTLYGANCVLLTVAAILFAKLMNGLNRSRPKSQWLSLSAVALLFLSPSVMSVFWWNIFSESRMIPLAILALGLFAQAETSNRTLCYVGSMTAFLVLFGYKETGFVPLGAVAGTFLLFGGRNRPVKERIFCALGVLACVAYLLFHLLVIKPQMAGSYMTDHQREFSFVLKCYLTNPILSASLALAVTRGIFAVCGRSGRHLLYDASLFAGSAYVLSYIMMRMTESYYPVPAYVFLVPTLIHWALWLIERCPRSKGVVLAGGFALLAWCSAGTWRDFVGNQALRHSDVPQVRDLAANAGVERIYMLLPEQGHVSDYMNLVFCRFFDYAGGDTTLVTRVTSAHALKPHEVLAIPCNVSEAAAPALVKSAVYVSRSSRYTLVYGPADDGVKWTEDGKGLVVSPGASCVSGLYGQEPWGAWGGQSVRVSVPIPESLRGSDLEAVARVGAMTSPNCPSNRVALKVAARELVREPVTYPPRPIVGVVRKSEINPAGFLDLELRSDAVVCPKDEGWSVDPRQMGVAFESLEIRIAK